MVFGFFDEPPKKYERHNENNNNERVIHNLDSNIKNDLDGIIVKYNLSQRRDIYNYSQKKPLIVHCCHHKTGTVVIEKILRTIAENYGLKYQYCSQKKLQPDTDIWMQHHSKVDLEAIDRPIIGTHMIRNPCSIIVSAYEYHKHTKEGWANRKINTLNKMTYKEILNSLNVEEGIVFEMKNILYVESSKNTIMDIYNWDYNMPNFLELRYEDFMMNFNGVVSNMLKHYGFSSEMIKNSLRMVQRYNLRNKKEDELARNGHITNKNIDLDKWKEYFNNDMLIRRFWKLYPADLFDKIGYSVNNLRDLEYSMENGGRGSVLYMSKKEKDELRKEELWKKYGGSNPYIIV